MDQQPLEDTQNGGFVPPADHFYCVDKDMPTQKNQFLPNTAFTSY
jgi:hypothetical protein